MSLTNDEEEESKVEESSKEINSKNETSLTKEDDSSSKQTHDKNTVNLNNSDSGLNPKYTFENYIVGSNNRFAHAAAVAVSENPGMYKI